MRVYGLGGIDTAGNAGVVRLLIDSVSMCLSFFTLIM